MSYTTTNASKTTPIDIKRQVYYLDMNGVWYNSNGVYVSGGGNLIWDGSTTATAEITINGEVQTNYITATDYFKQHRYGSTFKIVITPQSGYTFKGASIAEGQESAGITWDKAFTITGYITGNRTAYHSDGTPYQATTVGIRMQKETPDDTTTSTEEETTEEVSTIATESLVEPIATAETAMKPKGTDEEA